MTNEECPMYPWCNIEYFHGKGQDGDFFSFNCFLFDAVRIQLFNSAFC